MKILLHSCCAPCSTFPLYILRCEGDVVLGCYFNPNIYPDCERDKRWDVYKDWADKVGLDVTRMDESHREWAYAISGDTKEPGRCLLCYRFRMGKVARLAKALDCDSFTTSLLVSPYQDHEAIIRAMEKASEAEGVPHLYRDFRPGYRRGREMARGAHLYMQKYCGCEFSMKGG